MTHERDDGRSPFERLKLHYEDVDLVCSECGYEDSDGEWQAKTTGEEIQYRHVCPSCGAIRTRTLSVDEE